MLPASQASQYHTSSIALIGYFFFLGAFAALAAESAAALAAAESAAALAAAESAAAFIAAESTAGAAVMVVSPALVVSEPVPEPEPELQAAKAAIAKTNNSFFIV